MNKKHKTFYDKIVNKNHVFFDVDGVIVSSVPFYAKLIRDTLIELGAEGLPDDLTKYVGIGSQNTMNKFLPNKKYEEVAHRFEIALENSKDHKPELIPGSIELLRHLKKINKKTAAITSRSRAEVIGLFKHYNELGSLFDLSISKNDVLNIKPDPEGIIKAINHFGIQTSDAIFIGDSKHDLGAANAVGMDFLGVCTGVLTVEEWDNLNVDSIDINSLKSYFLY